jgi:hypothetical protein
MVNQIKTSRLPLLALAFLSLITGLITGLGRIGWSGMALPSMVHHGGIMIGGFLGTLIILEKIIPLKKKILYGIPVLSALSVMMFIFSLDEIAFVLLVAASVGLVLVFTYYFLQERSPVYFLMLIGSFCWLTGNLLLMKNEFYPQAVSWWMAFTLFVIGAERIELMKFLPVSPYQKLLFVGGLLLFVIGSLLSFHGIGNVITGLSLAFAAIWLLRHDIIGISIKKSGLTRYIAIALLSGYLCLFICGVFLMAFKTQAFAYDIVVHTFFIGFVLSMILAHGPIILPGVIGVHHKPYNRLFYICLIVLHVSWLTRAVSSILLEFETRRLSGILTTIAILGYFITLAVTTIMEVKQSSKLTNISR